MRVSQWSPAELPLLPHHAGLKRTRLQDVPFKEKGGSLGEWRVVFDSVLDPSIHRISPWRRTPVHGPTDGTIGLILNGAKHFPLSPSYGCLTPDLGRYFLTRKPRANGFLASAQAWENRA
ncbi:hypothetical protein DPEC_G00344770 [Dallia pectoralis]|uniref:Uncharacterized protein n=1 Tax=Dallia pectoralis TaxID=75939 RepID=A0ACC2F3D4_DALPE|nr:hypothetical protein DPEC_G00344770 [Dallia pectoralis]